MGRPIRLTGLLLALACGAPGDRAAGDSATTAVAGTDSTGAATNVAPGSTAASRAGERSAMFTLLREAAYPISVPGTDTVQLRDGRFEGQPVGGGATRAQVRLEEVIALGNLNGDDRLDAAVPIVVDLGGSGTFTHLALALRDGDVARPVVTVPVGDRVAIDSLRIAGDSVIAFTREHAAGQPMAGEATSARIRTFIWQDGKLSEPDARAR